jgi:hypothetical protein
VYTLKHFTTEEDCKRLGRRPVEDCVYPVHPPIPAPRQVGMLGVGWVRVVCHACKLQYDADQVEHYRHPRVLHVPQFVCPQGYIATSRRESTSVDDKPAEDERVGILEHALRSFREMHRRFTPSR